MAISSIGKRTTVTTSPAASFEIIAPSTIRPKLLEMCVIQTTATTLQLGLGRPAAIGVGPVSSLNLMDNPADGVSNVNTATSWTTTAPTVPAIFHRRFVSVTSAGNMVIWTFPFGLTIAASGTVVLWNLATIPICDVNIVVEE